MGERVGLFGGTFDPVHVGHLVAAVNVHYSLRLDRVLLMVANIPWQKEGLRVVSSPDDRFAMVKAAVAGVDGVEASRLEIDRGGVSYTADTVRQLVADSPEGEIFLIIGWDVAGSLDSWERLEEVKESVTLVVVNRPGSAPPHGLRASGWRVEQVTIPNLEISSTDLRERAVDGRPFDYLVPEAAVHVLRARGLYAVDR
jgi:nicotinate-nucleotide adenylyltransferase